GGRSATMRWLADASYWVYLVHLPVLFAIQYRLLDVPLHWIAKFALATASTLAVSFASYQVLVRHTVLGRLLDGNVPGPGRLGRRTTPSPIAGSARGHDGD
ncbi:MAG TPA: acyltransferase family protein, partial [Pseudoxanthomonas sp.]